MDKQFFEIENGIEKIAKDIVQYNSCDLIVALLSGALCFGIDRVESAIHATYFKKEADQIISYFNTAISNF